MPHTDYAKNLRLLCDEYGTITSVCQGMDFNRQQFNKYLSGKTRPSRHNHHRICEFFKIDEALLNAPYEEFSQQRKHRTRANADGLPDFFAQMIDTLPNDIDTLRRYIGYYYQTFYSIGFKGYILRSLISVYEEDGAVRSKAIEHLSDDSKEMSDSYVFKYLGTMFYLGDRIFLLEYETLTKVALNMTILKAAPGDEITTLSGVTTGVSSRATREPGACRNEWQYLGRQINVREALKSCRLYKRDSEEIDAALRQRIDNHSDDGAYLLRSF